MDYEVFALDCDLGDVVIGYREGYTLYYDSARDMGCIVPHGRPYSEWNWFEADHMNDVVRAFEATPGDH